MARIKPVNLYEELGWETLSDLVGAGVTADYTPSPGHNPQRIIPPSRGSPPPTIQYLEKYIDIISGCLAIIFPSTVSMMDIQ